LPPRRLRSGTAGSWDEALLPDDPSVGNRLEQKNALTLLQSQESVRSLLNDISFFVVFCRTAGCAASRAPGRSAPMTSPHERIEAITLVITILRSICDLIGTLL
jgi:hypothetical protein